MAFAAQNQTNPLVIDATGYTPYLLARADRASNEPGKNIQAERRAQAIRDFWIKKYFMEDLGRHVKKHDEDLFRSQWECEADKKGLNSRVQWEMDKILKKKEEQLEKRRDKLSRLLKAEDDSYQVEVSNLAGDIIGAKTSSMLERYKKLKTKKELERQKVAEEKKDLHFRINCDEYRTLVSKKLRKDIAEDEKQMIEEKVQEMRQRSHDQPLFDEMWVRDSELKEEKEIRDLKLQKKKDIEFGKQIVDQMNSKKLAEKRKLLQKETDAELMAENTRLFEIEKECERHLKKHMQERTKQDLDKQLRAKLKERVQKNQEDLMEDLFFLKQIMTDDEEIKKNEKKKSLMNEQQLYFNYLNEEIRKEAEFAREIDKLYQEECERMWEKREKEREADKRKRRQLELEVFKQIEEQIKAKMDKSRQLRDMNQRFAKQVFERDAEDEKKDREKLKLIRERNAVHQKELLEQIKNREDKSKLEKLRKKEEFEKLLKEHREIDEKVQRLFSNLKIDHEHPYRTQRARMAKDML